ncbi:MAG: SWIM zinc finger family protein [Conexivisphaera sp.]|jgi:uncharacterized Zn finger protein
MGWWYPRSRPRRVSGGIRARSQRGNIGSTWWSRRWIRTLESFGWESRLERGKAYARMGQVVDLRISKGHVEAKVQGSRRTPYEVTIDIRPIPEEEWRRAMAVMGSKAAFSAKLLSGEMPEDIESAFTGTPLFPRREDVESSCTCPDIANPCKHVAAVFYILAEELDRDPFLLFLLRGKDREEVIRGVGEEVAASANPGARPAPESGRSTVEEGSSGGPAEIGTSGDFWRMRAPIGTLELPVKGPVVDAALVKRLGEPRSWREPIDFRELMEALYREITARALEEAFR